MDAPVTYRAHLLPFKREEIGGGETQSHSILTVTEALVVIPELMALRV